MYEQNQAVASSVYVVMIFILLLLPENEKHTNKFVMVKSRKTLIIIKSCLYSYFVSENTKAFVNRDDLKINVH